MPSKRSSRILKKLAIAAFLIAAVVAMFLAAFVYNPFEGDLKDVRDAVPREVDFYARKTNLRTDFGDGNGLQVARGVLPQPSFWDSLADANGWRDLQPGPIARQAHELYMTWSRTQRVI